MWVVGVIERGTEVIRDSLGRVVSDYCLRGKQDGVISGPIGLNSFQGVTGLSGD